MAGEAKEGDSLDRGAAWFGQLGAQSHPDFLRLERFLRGETSRPEARAVVRHLLRGCPQCLQVTGRLWGLGELARPDKYLLAEMRRLLQERLGGRLSCEGEEHGP